MSLFDATWSLQVEKLLPPCLRDGDFTPTIDGDFLGGVADNNLIQYIIVSAPGHWKEFPLIGVAIFQFLQGTQSNQVLTRAIRLQLESDIFKKPFIDSSKFPVIRVNAIQFELG
jgi:hypothetical protein